MRKQQIFVKLSLVFIAIFNSPSIFAQTMNRAQLNNNIIANIYQNPNHAITGQTLQNVLLNQNYSYNNIKTDTNFVSVFDTGYSYFKGMAVLSGIDSIYRCSVLSHHGLWRSSDFRFVGLIGGGGSGIFGGGTVAYLPFFTANNVIENSTIIDGSYVGNIATHITNSNGLELDSTAAVYGIFGNPNPVSNLSSYRIGQKGLDSAMFLNVYTLAGGDFTLRCVPLLGESGIISLSQSKIQLSNITDTLPHASGTIAITSYHFDIQSTLPYNIPSNDFDGQTIVELVSSTPIASVTLPSPGSVPVGVPVIVKIKCNLMGPTTLQIFPFATESIDNNSGPILYNNSMPFPQATLKLLTPDNINWIIIP